MCSNELIDAACAALVSGRLKELQTLESLMEKPLSVNANAAQAHMPLRKLEMLLAATARNLRILRGQMQMDRKKSGVGGWTVIDESMLRPGVNRGDHQ